MMEALARGFHPRLHYLYRYAVGCTQFIVPTGDEADTWGGHQI